LGLGFYSTGLGWISVFIFQKTRFSVGFWVFSKKKIKNWKFSGKIVMKEEKNHSILQTYCKSLGCNGGKNLGSTKNQPKSLINPYITKSFGY
jgi:hypothetical protein